MTATERVYKGGKENEILSMDDPKDYGNTVYQMSYKEAIDTGVVADYKIVSLDVSNAELSEIIGNNEFVRLNNNPKQNQDITSRELATALALRKIFKKHKISKVISFHSSIKRANKFEELNKEINSKFQKYTQIETFHVSSNQTTSKRTNEMRSFENSTQSIITNARCLTEGVDVPAIDCVAFIDSKKSKVDIVQAAGRAMRINKGKKFGYILVPIITNYGDVKSGSIDTEYEDLISVITSLATQDERLIDEIKTIQSGKKRKSKSNIVNNVNILKHINPNEIDKNIKLKIWSKIASFSYLDYETTKKFAIKNNIKSNIGWRKLCLKKNFPIDITKQPDHTFKNKGWTSWGNFLDTKNLGYVKLAKNYYKYSEAKKISRKLGLVGKDQWRKYSNSSKYDFRLPRSPHIFYKNYNFSWYDFLGAKNKNDSTSLKYKSYDKAKKFIIKLKLNSSKEWQNYCLGEFKSLPKKPNSIPSNLGGYYRKTGEWRGFGDILGTGRIADQDKKYRSFDEAKKFFKRMNFKSKSEYEDYLNGKVIKSPKSLPNDIPKSLITYKKNKKWKSLHDFLGFDKKIHTGDYSSYKECKKFTSKLGLKSSSQWYEYCKKYNYSVIINDLIIPKAPKQYFSKTNVWKGWDDWLGESYDFNWTNNTRKLKYLNYQEAKKFIKKFNFKNIDEWKKFKKSKDFPKGVLRKNPYGYEGFVSMNDFLGKK